jgi:cysteine synthase
MPIIVIMIIKSILDLIGNTPLMRLKRIDMHMTGRIFGKLEYLQPGGSIKDRAAYQIITDAYAAKTLYKGKTVVEMTSGNMGSGLAVVCKQMGNPFVAVMPKGNSPERINILKALGAEVTLTEQVDGQPGMVTGKDIEQAVLVAKQIVHEKNCFYVDQFNNPSSVLAHYKTTGPEIWNALKETDVFVAAVGTGGTFVGTSKFLKSMNPKIKCLAVEPENAAIIKTGRVDEPKHIIQGTGYGLIPPHWETGLADEIITVTDDEVKEMTRRISLDQGLYVGYSAGANVLAAIKYLERTTEMLNVVTLLCDTGHKYGSL